MVCWMNSSNQCMSRGPPKTAVSSLGSYEQAKIERRIERRGSVGISPAPPGRSPGRLMSQFPFRVGRRRDPPCAHYFSVSTYPNLHPTAVRLDHWSRTSRPSTCRRLRQSSTCRLRPSKSLWPRWRPGSSLCPLRPRLIAWMSLRGSQDKGSYEAARSCSALCRACRSRALAGHLVEWKAGEGVCMLTPSAALQVAA